jgi:hypothetical protein
MRWFRDILLRSCFAMQRTLRARNSGLRIEATAS